ncbi:hypothetical protein [Paludibaculum fermentans]|uniref:hypothetical protein n=1 Tax=Paludibaculum fermentans TaxID=1473598 RepID=UPI003EBAF60A
MPVLTVSPQILSARGKARTGAIYVDDISLEFPSGPSVVEDFERTSSRLRVWMKGEPATVVMTGYGLANDLTPSAPFLLARRQAWATRFVSLMEPYQVQSAIRSFETGPGLYSIVHAGFEDTIGLDAANTLSFLRTRNSDPVSAIICNGNLVMARSRKMLELETAGSAELDWIDEGNTLDLTGSVQGMIRAWAPNAVVVRVNGEETAFAREDEYVVFRAGVPASN